MNFSSIRLLAFAVATAVLSGCAAVQTTPAADPAPKPAPAPSATAASGFVYTQTNDAKANAVLMLNRAADGSLTLAGSVATGGRGTGGGLQNQSSVALNAAGTLLFAVDAGSSDFAVFRVTSSGSLTLAATVPSGGLVPVSISEANGIVYVLNDGSRNASTDTISGFRVSFDGSVTPIANSTRALSTASTSAAQVALTPDAATALVTERGTALLDTFALDASGTPGLTMINTSAGAIPFGFQFLDSAHVFVSEEGTNGVSSYSVAGARTTAITRSAANHQSATCWLAIVPSGKFLYTTNTSAGTISAFSIAADRSIALIGTSGVAARANGAPIDAIVSRDGKYLFVVDSGDGIDSFAIGTDGSLSAPTHLGGLGAGLNGIAAS